MLSEGIDQTANPSYPQGLVRCAAKRGMLRLIRSTTHIPDHSTRWLQTRGPKRRA